MTRLNVTLKAMMHRLVVVLLLWQIPVACGAGRVNVFHNGREGYNVYRIPAIVRAANGDLLAFCEAREGGDASEIDLVLKRSTDEGATWGPIQVVQESDSFRSLFGADPPPITAGNPAPVVDLMDPEHPGRIWLPFTLENDRVFVTSSDDHGATWSERREITGDVKRDGWGWYATGPVHSIQIQRGPHRGRLVVPCDHRLGKGGADSGSCGAHVVYSDDHGATWLLGAFDDTYDDDLEAGETTVVELTGGRLYFNTRDEKGEAPGTRGASNSSDGGTSFDPSPQSRYKWFSPAPAVLDPPVVQCSLLRAASVAEGDPQSVILFCGPDNQGPSGGGRNDLRIRYSTDEAQSWRDGLLVHEGPAAYSDMVRIDPKQDRFGILYEAGSLPGSRYDRIDFVVHRLSALLADRQSADLSASVQPFVDRQELAGAVMLVADRERILVLEAVGAADIGAGRPMQADTMFWIASQSKPITAAALMMLVDAGQLALDDPVEKYLPEFQGQKVIVESSDTEIVLRKPGHPITIRNILSHTSGLPYKTLVEEPTLDLLPLSARVRSYAMAPLVFQPETSYLYSNCGINVAGRIVEVVSGLRFEQFLEERLCAPLGMRDTTFWPTEAQAARIAKSYKSGAAGQGLEETEIVYLSYPLTDRAARSSMPAGGLFSTAVDVLRFYRMLLNGGEFDGRRYLTKEAVQEMTRRQTAPDLKQNYGLGFQITNDTFGHGGAYGTNSTADSDTGRITIWLVQHASFPGDGAKAQAAFRQAAESW